MPWQFFRPWLSIIQMRLHGFFTSPPLIGDFSRDRIFLSLVHLMYTIAATSQCVELFSGNPLTKLFCEETEHGTYREGSFFSRPRRTLILLDSSSHNPRRQEIACIFPTFHSQGRHTFSKLTRDMYLLSF